LAWFNSSICFLTSASSSAETRSSLKEEFGSSLGLAGAAGSSEVGFLGVGLGLGSVVVEVELPPPPPPEPPELVNPPSPPPE